MKNRSGILTFVVLLIMLIVYPPMELNGVYFGFKFFGSSLYKIEYTRFIALLLLISVVSIVSNYYLNTVTSKLKALVVNNKLKIVAIAITIILLSCSIYYYDKHAKYLRNEEYKTRSSFYGIKLSDSIDSVLVNKGSPEWKGFNADSSVTFLNYYVDLGMLLQTAFHSDTLVYAITSGYSHYERRDHYYNTYNEIIKKYGAPNRSYFTEADSNEVIIYKKYNIIFVFKGDGRENKKVFEEGMINYDIWNRKF